MFGILTLPSGPKHVRSYLLWDTLVTIIFLKPEDGRGKFQRPVCRARVRHPDSLQVLLEFSAGREYSMT